VGERPVDPAEVERLARELLAFLRAEPRFFVEALRYFRAHDYRVFLLAWSRLREERRLGRDEVGRYVMLEGGEAGGSRG